MNLQLLLSYLVEFTKILKHFWKPNSTLEGEEIDPFLTMKCPFRLLRLHCFLVPLAEREPTLGAEEGLYLLMQVISLVQNGTEGTSSLDQSHVPDSPRTGHDEGNLWATYRAWPLMVMSLMWLPVSVLFQSTGFGGLWWERSKLCCPRFIWAIGTVFTPTF